MSRDPNQVRKEITTLRQETDSLSQRLGSIETQLAQLLELYRSQSDPRKDMKTLLELANDESNGQDEILSSQANDKKRYWTESEHLKFIQGVALFGKADVARIASFIRTRTQDQVRSHSQKYMLKLDKQLREAAEKLEASVVTFLQAAGGPFTAVSGRLSKAIKALAPQLPDHLDEQFAQLGCIHLKAASPPALGAFLDSFIGQKTADGIQKDFPAWDQKSLTLISSERYVLIEKNQFNVQHIQKDAEAALIQLISENADPSQFIVRATLVYESIGKIRDPMFYTILNAAQALGIELQKMVALAFYLSMCAM